MDTEIIMTGSPIEKDWGEEQRNAFFAWAGGDVIEKQNSKTDHWEIVTDSVLFSKDTAYRVKLRPSFGSGAPRPYKRRGNFRFRWKDVLEAWLDGEECRFYDEKKQEWHSIRPDTHMWDCITLYEIKA